MKILDAKVDWHEEYNNVPTLKVLVDKMPDWDSHVYEQRGNLYFSEIDGMVSFYYYSQPGEGFGGRKFTLKIKDGSIKELIGPWSSNSDAMNDAGFTPCKEVSITDEKDVWKRGYTFWASSITLDLWKKAIDEFCPDAHYVEIITGKPFSQEASMEQSAVIGNTKDTIIKYEIARKGMTFNEFQAFKGAKRSLKIIQEFKDGEIPSWISSWGSHEERLKKCIENKNSHVKFYNNLVVEHNLEKFGLQLA